MKNKRTLWRALGVAAVAALIGLATTACGDDGSTTHDCARVGHLWGEWARDPAPTCVAPGVNARTCQHCGLRVTETLFPLDHDWPEYWNIVDPATCTTDGIERRYCRRDGCESPPEQRIIHHGHLPSGWGVRYPADCIRAGYEVRICLICDATLEGRMIDMMGHIWSAWTATGDDGRYSRTCSRPGCPVVIVYRSDTGHCGCGQACCVREEDCDDWDCQDLYDDCVCPVLG